jgi:hypothetical protein
MHCGKQTDWISSAGLEAVKQSCIQHVKALKDHPNALDGCSARNMHTHSIG